MGLDLASTYEAVHKIIEAVDFSRLWEGFQPLKFALYDESTCYFDGAYIPKTDEFLANTAIFYKGEYIAIWNVMEAGDVEILASKMIHEMFHAFQYMNRESRFPDEMEALARYVYSPEHLSIKAAENRLLAELSGQFEEEGFQSLLQYRKYRYSHFPYEYAYEAAVEQVEGTACYVELCALEQISREKYGRSLERMCGQICNDENLIPVRPVCYTTGALLFKLLQEKQLLDFMTFSGEPAMITLVKAVKEEKGVPVSGGVRALVQKDFLRMEELIGETLALGRCVAEGELELLGVNVYNARCCGGYILSNYFVMYKSGGREQTKYGDFVIECGESGKAVRIFEAAQPLG